MIYDPKLSPIFPTIAHFKATTVHLNSLNVFLVISCSLHVSVKVSGDSKGLSFCLKKLILRLWAAQNRPPSNQIPVTHNTNGFQVWSRHTAPPGGQEVQNVSF